MKVLVCGKPGSGNRLVISLYQSADVMTMLWHGENGDPKNADSWTHVVVPIRAEAIREASRAKSRPDYEEPEEWDRRDFASRKGIPILEIDYRKIVEQPDEARIELLEFVDQPTTTQWPAPVYDGDVGYSF